MENHNEEQDDMNIVFELQEATEIVDEVQTPVASIDLNEELCDKLIKFTLPKVSASIIGVKYECMEQMILLKTMDPKKVKETPADNRDCCTHESRMQTL